MKLRYLFIIAVSVLVLASCGSGRKAATQVTGYENLDANTELSRKQLNELFSSLQSSYGAWNDVKMPVKLRLRSPKQVSVSGTMTMVSGKSIGLSFKVFGMEVAQISVTADSIYALYKMDKVYFAEDIAGFMGDFPATVGNLQDLLLGRAFVLGDGAMRSSGCLLAGNGASWTITPQDAPAGMSYEFEVSLPLNRVSSMSVNIPSRSPIVASYADTEMTAVGVAAAETTIRAKTSKAELEASIELNLNRAEWNTGSVKPWTAPKGYRRITKAEVAKMIKAMGKI